jgi:hypothetical protein
MSDPKRLLDEGESATPLVRRLIQTGQQMKPPAGAVGRGWQDFLALNGVPVAAPEVAAQVSVASGQAVPPVVGSVSKAALPAATLVKTFAAGAVLGVVTVLGAQAVERVVKPAVRPVPTLVAPPAGPPGVSGAASASSSSPVAPDPTTTTVLVDPTPTGSRHRVPASAVPNEDEGPPAPELAAAGPSVATFPVDAAKRESLLKAEARDVADAKAMIAEGRAVEALVFLGRSSERFKDGTLGQEREALIIEALAASGQREPAKARARDFLARNPRSPLAERVKGVLR